MMLLTAAFGLALHLTAQPNPAPKPEHIDHCRSAIVAQTRAALEELHAAAAVHGLPGHGAIAAVYEGTVAIEDHLMRPGMVRTVPIRLEMVVEGPGAAAMALRQISGPRESPRTETTLVRRGRAAKQPAADRPFAELEPPEARELIADLATWLPWTAAGAALAAAPSCRPGLQVSSLDSGGEPWSPVTFTDAAGRASTLLLDPQRRVRRVERLEAHQRLGDACHWTQFDDWQEEDGVTAPRRLSRFVVRAASSARYDLTLAALAAGPTGDAAFDLPEPHRGDIPDWSVTPPATSGMEFVALAPTLWSVEIAAADARVLVVERESDLVLLGAPDGDAVCRALVLALAERFPGKPVAVATFGHHHPSPSGGLRALAAAGATIVAPRQLEPYVRWLLARPTSLGGPAVAAPEAVSLRLFEGESTIDAGEMSVRLVDIGERSAHTFCYVVFYLPGPGVLFEDDLGYFPLTSAARVGPRLTGLADALDDRGIVPERLLQLWPVRGVHREVPWSDVADMIRAHREKSDPK